MDFWIEMSKYRLLKQQQQQQNKQTNKQKT